MTIRITVTAANQAEYKDALRALNEGAGPAEIDLGEIIKPEVKIVPQAAAPKPQAATWAPGGSATSETAPAPQKATVQAPVPAAEELPVPAAAPPQQAPKPVTIADLQSAGRKLALTGKSDALSAILAEYGSRNITGLPKEVWAEALAKMEEAAQ